MALSQLQQLAGMAARLDLLGLREFEAQLRRDFTADSLGPVLEAIAARRLELAKAGPVPTCVYCGKPCDKPVGRFAAER